MNRRTGTVCNRLAMAVALQSLAATGGSIPRELPRPDGKPGNATKPVKVYILAGQSNMVGMGDITGARPLYPSVFLSADPAIIPGIMPIGGSALAAHGVYQSADPKAERARWSPSTRAPYDPKADYAKLTPAKTATVALGTVAENLPTIDGPHTVVATAWIDVPATRHLHPAPRLRRQHARHRDSGRQGGLPQGAGGKPVCDESRPRSGQALSDHDHLFRAVRPRSGWSRLTSWARATRDVDEEGQEVPVPAGRAGKWTVRNDVYYKEARLASGKVPARRCPQPQQWGKSIGPEVGFGYVMGTFHDEQVLLIKTAQGNRSLGFDFRPPSSGRTEPANEFEGLEYRLMVKGVRETLDKIDKIVPGYKGQGYEIAGFGWFQGHKDSGAPKEEYEKHLVNLINDLRKEFKAPKMPAVVATVGFNGYRLAERAVEGRLGGADGGGRSEAAPGVCRHGGLGGHPRFLAGGGRVAQGAGLPLQPQCRDLHAGGRGDGAGDGAPAGRRGRGDSEVGSRSPDGRPSGCRGREAGADGRAESRLAGGDQADDPRRRAGGIPEQSPEPAAAAGGGQGREAREGVAAPE